jgi:hypothetical protein
MNRPWLGVNQGGAIVMTGCRAERTNLAGLQLWDITTGSADVVIVDMHICSDIDHAATQTAMGANSYGW